MFVNHYVDGYMLCNVGICSRMWVLRSNVWCSATLPFCSPEWKGGTDLVGLARPRKKYLLKIRKHYALWMVSSWSLCSPPVGGGNGWRDQFWTFFSEMFFFWCVLAFVDLICINKVRTSTGFGDWQACVPCPRYHGWLTSIENGMDMLEMFSHPSSPPCFIWLAMQATPSEKIKKRVWQLIIFFPCVHSGVPACRTSKSAESLGN